MDLRRRRRARRGGARRARGLPHGGTRRAAGRGDQSGADGARDGVRRFRDRHVRPRAPHGRRRPRDAVRASRRRAAPHLGRDRRRLEPERVRDRHRRREVGHAPSRSQGRIAEPRMNAFVWAATGLLLAYFPLLWVVARRRPIDGLVALECGGIVLVLVLVCLAEGFHRSLAYTVAIVAAVMSWIGGLVFARFLGRWL